MTQTDQQNVPQLRFPGFTAPHQITKLGDVATFYKGKGISKNDIDPDGAMPCIRYGELYTVYDTVIDEPISRTNVPAELLTLSKGDEVLVPASGEDAKDIATAVVIKRPGVALGGDLNIIRSENDGAFLASYLSGRKRMVLASMAQGNSVVHLYPAQLKNLDLYLPTLPEQRKIAEFLEAVDTKIAQISAKKRLLEEYKKGCMQQLFSQKIRFKDDAGNDFPDWEEKPLHTFLTETKEKSDGTEAVFSVSVHKGLIDQVEHLGRSFSAANTDHYNRVEPGDIVYTKSPTGDFPYGIIKQSRLNTAVIVSPLYGVFRPETAWLGYWLHVYFESNIHTGNYLKPIIQKGAKNTINITNTTFLSAKLKVPNHPDEQRKIADFLSALDRKIDLVAQELELAQAFKKGLLQQMFV